MSFERYIAIRYLVSKKQVGLVTVISFISIVGVTIGVAALVVILSVFNGFSSFVTSLLVNFDPHLKVESVRKSSISEYRTLMDYLSKSTEVKGFSPYVVGKAVIVSRGTNKVVNIKGVDADRIANASGIQGRIVLGSLDLNRNNKQGIVLGITLADRLGVIVGDTLALVSFSHSELALIRWEQPLIRKFHIVGIFESNNKEYDSFYAYVGLSAAQTLLGLGDRVDGIELRLKALEDSEYLQHLLSQKLGTSYRILTWYDLHKELYAVMQIERWIAYIVLSLIIGVASFNLLGSLTMSVIEKTRDIGVLKSLGATRRSITRIFMVEGFLVGVVGSLVGLALGLGIVYLQDQYHLFPLDQTVYLIPAIPVEVHMLDLIVIPLTAIGVCSLAALYPAKRAANLVPVEAIRWE